MQETRIKRIKPRVVASVKPFKAIPKDVEATMNIILRIEKLNGKCILEKDNDMVLRNLVRLLYHIFAQYDAMQTPAITIREYSGADKTGYWGYSELIGAEVRRVGGWNSQGNVNTDSSGIVIGTGTTAPTRTDYMMEAKIAHGGGVGQITYNLQTYSLLSDYQFRLTREFTNAGSNLSVSEAGLIYATVITGASWSILLLHDTFTPVSVTTGNGIRVKYTFSF